MSESSKSSYQLPKLNYSFEGLEPVISKETLEIHYSKHHAAYVKNLNEALNEYHKAESENDIAKMIKLQSLIKFNGGGHVNHTLFWENLAPIKENKNKPSGKFLKAAESSFGSMQNLIEEFNKQTIAIQGSGWGWIGYNKMNKSLEIVTTVKHKTISAFGLIPILIVDVWEHAYYLQYRNERSRFVNEIWKIINFEEVEKRFHKAIV